MVFTSTISASKIASIGFVAIVCAGILRRLCRIELPLYLPYISAISPLYLRYISAISRRLCRIALPAYCMRAMRHVSVASSHSERRSIFESCSSGMNEDMMSCLSLSWRESSRICTGEI